MLSVCIPVYNFNIELLLSQLRESITIAGIQAEIVIAEDGSRLFLDSNKAMAEKFKCRYLVQTENTGRSAIRNFLCSQAISENLLFLDCDSLLPDTKLISTYMPWLNKDVVVYGGTCYQHLAPEKKYRLHWQYGRTREVRSLEERRSHPERHFKTNNFLIPKKILAAYPFNESLQGYGHEDTLMGICFSQNDIEVVQIENPVLHNGLETTEEFLRKTGQSLSNLLLIQDNFKNKMLLNQHITILKVYNQLAPVRFLVKIIWLALNPMLLIAIRRFLWIRGLDFFKLGYLCFISDKKRGRLKSRLPSNFDSAQ